MENIQNIENAIAKSPNDPNLYRYVSLSNGIKAFLISNPHASTQIHFDSNETQKLSKKSTFQQSKEYSKANAPDSKFKHKSEKKPTIEEVSDQEKEQEEEEEDMEEELPEEDLKSQLKQNQENLMENQEKINKISQGVSSIVVLIETGSSNEPKKFHGLAHLLEHVIFLGCKEFPEQDSFSQFISNHGGSDNGRTSLDYTFFDFTIENEFLFEALYRFSCLLKDPLFPENGIEKELKAVNNEFELSQTSDGSRNFQILLDSSHPDSKYNSFSWGSLESLNHGAKILRQEIIKYFKKYYISDKIKICIYSKIGLDELQGYVEKSFGCINRYTVENQNNNEKNTENCDDNLNKDTEDLHRSYYSGMFYVETVKNEHLLIISWALKPFLHHYRSRSVQPITSVLNDEGPNSLCSYLKKADLINSIYSYVDDDDGLNSLFMLFTIEVDLTQKGIENWCEIIYEVFKYIDLIKQKPGIPEYYFEELKILAEKKFLFDDEENPDSMVEKLAFLLTFVEPKELILVYSGLFLEKNTIFFEEILEQLRIDNVRVTFMSSKESFPKRINLNLEEKWFHTKFYKESTADFLLPSLKTITHSTSDYKFPLENPFLPKHLEVLKCLNENETIPRVILCNHGEKNINNNNDEIYPKIKCWHFFDIKELKPKICIEVIILFKFINENIEDQVNLEFFIEYFSEKFNEIIGYQSSEAEICFEVSLFEGKGINFSIYGYFDKIEVFLEKTFNLYTNVCLSPIENKLFYQIKNRLLKDLKNYCLDLESQLQEAINNFIFPDYFLPEDYEKYLDNYQINEFQEFCNKNFQSFENFFSITGYFHGNLYKDMALNLLNKITFILKEQLNSKKDLSKGLITKDFICKKMLALPSKNLNWKNKIVTRAKNEENKNFLVIKYIDFGKYDITERNKLTLLLSILSPQVHEILRMRKQIGYLANATLIDVRNKLGIMIIVNSSEKNFDEIDSEINNFIQYFIDDFLEFQFSEMEFNNIINGIIAKKLEVLRDMKLNCSRIWGEIVLNELIFNRTNKNIEILKGFQLKEIKAWIRNKFIDPKKMFILGVIPQKSKFNQEEDLQEFLKDCRAKYYNDFDMDLFNYEFFK